MNKRIQEIRDRKCSTCHVIYSGDLSKHFYKSYKGGNGLSAQCKKCKKKHEGKVPSGKKWCPECDKVLSTESFAKKITIFGKKSFQVYCRSCYKVRRLRRKRIK